MNSWSNNSCVVHLCSSYNIYNSDLHIDVMKVEMQALCKKDYQQPPNIIWLWQRIQSEIRLIFTILFLFSHLFLICLFSWSCDRTPLCTLLEIYQLLKGASVILVSSIFFMAPNYRYYWNKGCLDKLANKQGREIIRTVI